MKCEIEKPTASPDCLSISLTSKLLSLRRAKSQQISRYLYITNQPFPETRRSIHLQRTKTITTENSTQIVSDKHDRAFDDILRLNGYPENVIDEDKFSQNQQDKTPKPLPRNGRTSKSHSTQNDQTTKSQRSSTEKDRTPSKQRPQILHIKLFLVKGIHE